MKNLMAAPIIILFLSNFLLCQSIKKVVLNDKDSISGYYLAVEPSADSIARVLALLPGFGEKSESIFPETKLHNVAYVPIQFLYSTRLGLPTECDIGNSLAILFNSGINIGKGGDKVTVGDFEL
jgi:hypothetical protein